MITLSDLRNRARNRSDQLNSKFVSDSELNIYIQDSYGELYDILVSSYQDYFVNDPVSFTISSGNSYQIASDFYKILGVDVNLSGGDWFEMKPFNFFDRNNQINGSRFINFGVYAALRYRVMGSKILITPTDIAANNSFRYWYIPNATALVADTDAIVTECERWSVYIETDAAIKMMAKEESDVSVLMAQKDALKVRIKEMSVNRDAGYPETITDVRTGRTLGYGYGRF